MNAAQAEREQGTGKREGRINGREGEPGRRASKRGESLGDERAKGGSAATPPPSPSLSSLSLSLSLVALWSPLGRGLSQGALKAMLSRVCRVSSLQGTGKRRRGRKIEMGSEKGGNRGSETVGSKRTGLGTKGSGGPAFSPPLLPPPHSLPFPRQPRARGSDPPSAPAPLCAPPPVLSRSRGGRCVPVGFVAHRGSSRVPLRLPRRDPRVLARAAADPAARRGPRGRRTWRGQARPSPGQTTWRTRC